MSWEESQIAQFEEGRKEQELDLRREDSQDSFNIRLASSGEIPASFQKYHPAGGPAIFPIEIRQSAGGFCSPRSHREITMDEHLRCFPKSN